MESEPPSTQIVDELSDANTNTHEIAYILFDCPTLTGRKYYIGRETLIVGRHQNCTVKINDASLSREHAALHRDEHGLCFLSDLGSSNGTWRNDLRLRPHLHYELRTSDRIKFGRISGTFYTQSGEQSDCSKLVQPDGPSFRSPQKQQDATSLQSDTSSTVSSHLLAPVLIDTATEDLLPNGSQYVSRSPSPIIDSQRPPSLLSEIAECQNRLLHDDLSLDDQALIPESEPPLDNLVLSDASTHPSDSPRPPNDVASTIANPVITASTPCVPDRSGGTLLVFDSEPRTGKSSKPPCITESIDLLDSIDHSAGFVAESQFAEEALQAPVSIPSKAQFSSMARLEPPTEPTTETNTNDPSIAEADLCEATQPMTYHSPRVSVSDGRRTNVGFEDTESTQPMMRASILPLIKSACRSVHVDLDDSQLSGDSPSAQRPRSPELDNLPPPSMPTRKSTPANSRPLLPKRQLQTTVSKLGRQRRPSRRVSELFLSDAIGKVKFRSRTRGSLSKIDPNTPEDVASEGLSLLTGTPMGLVRRASQLFTAGKENGLVSPAYSSYKSKSIKGSKANLPPIPSPVQFPDSILSEDQSQLEDGFKVPASEDVNMPGNAQGESHSDSKAVIVLSPLNARKSAIRSAGFDESPQELHVEDSLKRISEQVFLNSTPQPMVDLSFSDIDLSNHHASGNKKSRRSTELDDVPPMVATRGGGKRGRPRASSVASQAPVRRSRRLTAVMDRRLSPPEPTKRSVKSSRVSRVVSAHSPVKESTTTFKLLFSGFDASKFASVLISLDAVETQDMLLATHLVADGWKRTLKMLYARARGIPVVSVNWLIACRRNRKPPLPDFSKFLLQPPSSPSRRRSVGVDGPFMTGWCLRCTPGTVSPPASELAQLCELAGGQWMTDKQLMEKSKGQPERTVILTTSEEIATLMKQTKRRRDSLNSKTFRLWESVVSTLPCVSVDWFLQSIMLRATPKWPIERAIRLN